MDGFKFSFGHDNGATESFEAEAGNTDAAATARTAENAGNPDAAASAERAGGSAESEKLAGKTSRSSVKNIPVPDVPKVSKPRKPRESKATTKAELKELENNISLVTMGLFSLTASMLKADYFAISMEEAATIAAPLSRIIDRMEYSETVNKYSDGMALIIAVVVITLPRAMQYQAEHKPPVNEGIKIVNTERTPSGESAGNNITHIPANTPNVSSSDKGINTIISAGLTEY